MKSMSNIKPLAPTMLCRCCDPGQFTFETTAELEVLGTTIGQDRAVAAARFGIGMQREGYNLFVLGPPGIGKQTLIRAFLEQEANAKPAPADWCYINNFKHPHQPRALQLPPGQGTVLSQDMDHLIDELRSIIPAVFEAEDYRTRRQTLEDEFKVREERVFEQLEQQAKERGIGVIRTPVGLAFAPIRDGHVLAPDEFQILPESEQERIKTAINEFQQQFQAALRQAPQWEREFQNRLKELDQEVALLAVEHPIDELRHKYESLPEVRDYLNEVQQDIIENVADFRPTDRMLAGMLTGMPLTRSSFDSFPFRRYQINVLVDHGNNGGAPVVYEDHPTHQNLVGQVEYMVAPMGALMTDFNLIKAGALHRANGGYLVLDAYKILQQPYAWEQLKLVLRSREIRIESLGQIFGLISTVSIKPEPIPLDAKIILLGDRLLYYLLYQYDPDFRELFKVEVDFEEEMARNSDNDLLYARLIGTLAHKEGLHHFDRAAVARVIEQSARLTGDAEKLSTHMQSIADLLREADYWANQANHTVVNAADVQQAIDAQIYRAGRIRDQIQEDIQRETILLDTTGEKIGQINGLSVIELGNFAFGRPSRITARVWLGKGEVVDIEREVELGGPLHSKGVLILSSFLGARYAIKQPLSLSASLVFEQSYSGVEGDSASSAELYALLSALAEAPIKQSLAVTGSVNQHGQVQPIGGVNEKIEGFFDVCRARGLIGEQGALIPKANEKHLMLRQDVIEAVVAERFHIYAIETIDQGIELLTGIPAGERDEAGNFPEGTINQRIEARLADMAESLREHSAPKAALEAGE